MARNGAPGETCFRLRSSAARTYLFQAWIVSGLRSAAIVWTGEESATMKIAASPGRGRHVPADPVSSCMQERKSLFICFRCLEYGEGSSATAAHWLPTH